MAINSLNAASRGYAGLVSGINTEETVEKMLVGTQTKIDKANQKKTVLQYKQQLYRDVMTQLKTLQSGYLSFSSGTNLLSSSFYNNMNAAITNATGTSNAGFSVTASSKATAGNTSVEYIKQLATAFSQETTYAASGAVGGKLDAAVAQNLLNKYRGIDPTLPSDHYAQGADAKLTIRVGDKGVTFENAPELFGGKTASEVVSILNAEFDLKGVGAEARYLNGKLSIIADNAEEYITVHGNLATDSPDKTLSMKMFGNVSSLSGQGTFSAAIDTNQYQPSFTVNLDGRQQEIYIGLDKLDAYVKATTAVPPVPGDIQTAAEGLAADIQTSLAKAFGNGVSVKATTADGETNFSFSSGTTSQKFTITGDSTVMSLMGLKTGISNKLSPNMAIRDLNFTNTLQGNVFSFNINGTDFSYTGDTSLSTIMNDINNSKAGVKVSYSESKDRFTIQSAETGAGYENGISISQSEGNLLSALFGLEGSGAVTGFGIEKTLSSGELTESDRNAFAKGGTFTFNVSGRDYRFTVPAKASGDDYTAEEFAEKINSAFASSFSFMPDGTQAIQFKYDATGKNFSIVSNNPDLVVKTVKQDDDTNKSLLGFAVGDSTRITDGAAKLSDADMLFGDNSKISIKIDDTTTIEVKKADIEDGITFDKLAEVIQKKINDVTGLENVEVKFDKNSAAFRIAGVDIPMEITVINGSDGKGLEKLFGQEKILLNSAEYSRTDTDGEGNPVTVKGLSTISKGQNAIISINGVEIQRASNSFEYDGLTFTLHTPSKTDDNGNYVDGPANIAVSRDTDTIVEGIKEFLTAYNETVNFLNGLYKSDATYKNYPPLTDAQKASMSDREVELWEEKAREGLLRNDSNVQRILDAMRKAMYTKPADSSIAIYDLGISTSYYISDGNLQEMTEGDLKAFVEKDPEAVQRLFAGEGGLMTLLNDAINDAVRSSYANQGYITSVAGSNGLDTSSAIYKQIKEIDDQLITLENRYWSEYDRYWKQFNAMEQLIQQMNTQSSWLSQSLGG